MNWLFFLVIALFVLYMYIGWKKGMIRMVMSFVALIAGICITSVAAPQLSRYVMDNTPIYDTIRENTYNSLEERGMVKGAIASAGTESGIEDAGNLTIDQMGANLDEFVKNVASQLPLPQTIQEKVEDISIGDSISLGINNTAAKVEDVITNFVAVCVTGMICSAGCYIIVFLVVYTILYLVLKLVNGISRLPVINELNKGLGVLFGLVKAILIVWIFFVAVTVLYNTEFAQAVMTCVNGNAFLSWLYDNNLIMNILFSSVIG